MGAREYSNSLHSTVKLEVKIKKLELEKIQVEKQLEEVNVANSKLKNEIDAYTREAAKQKNSLMKLKKTSQQETELGQITLRSLEEARDKADDYQEKYEVTKSELDDLKETSAI